MNRKKAVELLPIIKAISQGKAIQVKENNVWEDVDDNHNCVFLPESYEYRIKPEPKYRPFKDAEECWKEMRKHYPFGWVKLKATGKYFIQKAVGDFLAVVGLDDRPTSYDKLFEEYTFADGIPFGVKVEED